MEKTPKESDVYVIHAEDGRQSSDPQFIEKPGFHAEQSSEFQSSRPSGLLILIVLVSSVSHLMFGYDTGYISSALVSVKTDLSNKELSSGEQEFITSATSLGAFCGAIICGTLADNIGRKYTSIFANLFLIVGAAMQCGAHTVWVMIGGRFVMGWGVGIGSVIAPLFITELSPPRFRGRLVTIASIIRTGAQLVAYAIGAGLQSVHGGWRILVGISIVPTVIQSILLMFLPESPRFLVLKDRLDAARRVIEKTHVGASPELVEAKITELVVATKEAYPPGTTAVGRVLRKLRDLHRVPSNLRALIIVCGCQGINQFTGFNSLMYFSATIFQIVGFANSTAVSIIVAGTNFVFTLPVFVLIDRLGRRFLMLLSLAGMVVALVLNSIAFHFMDIKWNGDDVVTPDSSSVSSWGIVILVAMMLYVAFYAIGVGAVPWQQSELFPMSVRGLGSSFATCTNWAGSLIIAATFLTMMKNITPTGTFAFFAGISLISLIFIAFLYPELSNLGLEETQEMLSNGFNVRKSVALSKERSSKHQEA
uniref:ARAD1C40678p n=1 Tax=Blastobotrys adeninivorans TaxID=409370 RepID=A0A060T916_BLAAD